MDLNLKLDEAQEKAEIAPKCYSDLDQSHPSLAGVSMFSFLPHPQAAELGEKRNQALSRLYSFGWRLDICIHCPDMEERVAVSEQKWISVKTRTSSGFKAMAGSSPQWWHVIGEETETLSLEALKLELREETQGALVLLKGVAFTGPKEQEEVKWLVRGHKLIRCRPGTRAVPPASGPGPIHFHATCLPDQWLKIPLINCGPKCVC